jgi:hypothetical protein
MSTSPALISPPSWRTCRRGSLDDDKIRSAGKPRLVGVDELEVHVDVKIT